MEISPDLAAQVSNIPYFCPICGALCTKQDVDGILCWVCPEGDWIDPV